MPETTKRSRDRCVKYVASAIAAITSLVAIYISLKNKVEIGSFYYVYFKYASELFGSEIFLILNPYSYYYVVLLMPRIPILLMREPTHWRSLALFLLPLLVFIEMLIMSRVRLRTRVWTYSALAIIVALFSFPSSWLQENWKPHPVIWIMAYYIFGIFVCIIITIVLRAMACRIFVSKTPSVVKLGK